MVCTSFDADDAQADDVFLAACGASCTLPSARNAFASSLPELRTGRQGEAALPAGLAERYGAQLAPRMGYSNLYWRAMRGRA